MIHHWGPEAPMSELRYGIQAYERFHRAVPQATAVIRADPLVVQIEIDLKYGPV